MSDVSGSVTCVGLGPGDPDLMSVRSDRLIRSARHVAFFRKKGRAGQARTIVNGMLADDVIEYPMEYPVTTEVSFADPAYKDLLTPFYNDWADRLSEIANEDDVVVLCEGDPFFYGSFMHLHSRLQGRVPVSVVPGITGMSGCWTATDMPITWGDDVLTVLMGTLDETLLVEHMNGADALVVMKLGRNLPKVKRALEVAGRLPDAWLVERGTMKGQTVQKLTDADVNATPYFAIVLVHGQGRRP